MVPDFNANPISLLQAASAIESFTIESPIKKLQMESVANKENIQARYDADEVAVPIKGIPDFDAPKKQDEPAEDNNKLAEQDEPILRENGQRFVLFPIKYHEVSARSVTGFGRVKWLHRHALIHHHRSGKCTRRQRLPSGPPRRSIYPRISTTGTSD
jgi:hypothetical protein